MKEGPRIVFSPRLLAVLGLLVAGALRLGLGPLRLPWTAAPIPWIRGLLGGVLSLFGLALAAAAGAHFRAQRENSKPSSGSRQLVTGGPYRWSRNPMYVGGASAQIGLALAVDDLWFAVLAVPVVVATHFLAVRPEEAYLERTFGELYRAYAARVPRWLGWPRSDRERGVH